MVIRIPRPLLVVVGALVLVATSVAVAAAATTSHAPTPPTQAAPPSPPKAPSSTNPNPHAVPTTEDSYVKVTPCRVLDTRAKGGTMTNADRTFIAVGDLAGQGGKSGGCGIPGDATSLALNITAIAASGNGGYVHGWAANTAETNATLLNFSPAINASNMVNLPITYLDGRKGFHLKTYGSANLVADVVGYYIPPLAGMVDGTTATVYAGSSRIVSATRNGVGSYTVTFDRDVAYCTPTVTDYSGYVYASAYAFNGSKVQVYTWYLSSSTHAETAADTYFYISVDC